MPITIYNNYVRWMWAYVQYIGRIRTATPNLSANSDAKWPDTKYSQSLAIVPQVFTVLGIPLWDTNTVDVTLTFPPDAHKARLLYCGLGNDVYGGGWRQYFPSDAYPDRIAPTDEVLFPALVTGIFTIGLNVFALATDIAAAVAWQAFRTLLNPTDMDATLKPAQAIVGAGWRRTVLTAAEGTAVGIASGGATYAAIANRGDNVNNIWSILLSIGSIIPEAALQPRDSDFFVNSWRYKCCPRWLRPN